MKHIGLYRLIVTALLYNVIPVTAITNSADTDSLRLNRLQDGGGPASKYTDSVSRAESKEKRSFFKPDSDRRGSFYPSGHSNTGVGSVFNVGSTAGHGPHYHTSGNGYSYGAPSVGYPPVLYGGTYPAPSASSGSSGFGHGGFGLSPATAHGGGYNKVMALKGLLIPIAGVALLGAAAALAKSNPVLLQLGVISGKKKRSLQSGDLYPANPYVQPENHKAI